MAPPRRKKRHRPQSLWFRIPPKRKAAEIPPEECEAASEGAGQLYERIQDLLVGLLREIAAKKKLRLNSLLQPIEQMAGREENLEALYSLSLQNRFL
jgi:hypothetical protein